MSLLQHSDVYWKLLGQCTQCGYCTKACPSLTEAEMTLGDVAGALLDKQRQATDANHLAQLIQSDPGLVQAVRGCFFCTTCQNTCFAHNDVCDLIYHARVDFQDLGLIPRYAWSSVLVDEEWHIYTAYRAIYGIGFTDLTRHVETEEHGADTGFEVAFFPGCSMAAYAPELTREIFATLEELGGKTTMVDHCCGSPLKSAGFFDRAEALTAHIAQEVLSSGAKTVVCVCPGCRNAVRDALAKAGATDVDVQPLAQFLLEHGFVSKRPLGQQQLCISKSCQDRDGFVLEQTQELLQAGPDTVTVFHGCCGAGGAVSAFDPSRQATQADEKLSFAPDGSTVVSMCPTCTYTYAQQLLSNPRDIQNKHYSELVFENQFDWIEVFSQLQGMWTGEYGDWLAQVFA